MNYPQPTRWFIPAPALKRSIEDKVLSWLTDEGSLTERLKGRCHEQFTVSVLGEEWCKPEHSEQQLLNMSDSQQALLRQVHLKCADDTLVYARSIIPPSTLEGKHKGLLELGDKPLGEYLFSCPTLVRSRVEWSKLTPECSLYQIATQHQPADALPVWGRRSLFHIDDKPLLVSEFFLPNLFK